MNFSFNSQQSSTINAEPLRILILGEFSSSVEALHSARINSDNFDQVLNRFEISCEFAVSNHISSNGKEIHIKFQPECLSDFHPLQLIENIPILKELYELLQLCQQYQYRQIDETAFKNRISTYQHFGSQQLEKLVSAPAVHELDELADEADDRIDRLFDMVDIPDDETSREPKKTTAVTQGLDRLVGDLIGGSTRQNISGFVRQCQERLALQLNSILHHVTFQKMEALWRGLRLFIDQCDFRIPLYVDLINCPEDFPADFLEKLKRKLDNEENPYSTVFVTREFNNSPFDLELMEKLAQLADDQQTPLILGLEPHFLGCSDFTPLKNGQSLFQAGNYDKFRSIQEKEHSRWLGLCFNPFLARNPHQIRKKNLLEYHENWVHGDYLWGNPIWIFASSLVNSQKHYSWPSNITGRQNAMDHLPITGKHALNPFSPLLYAIPANIAEDLSQMGINSLVGISQRDSAFFPYARSLVKATHYQDQRANETSRSMASLPYLLLLRQIINNILKFKVQHQGELRDTAIWQGYLEQLLHNTGPGHDVMCRIEQHHGQDVLYLDLIAGDNVGHFPPFQFSFPI